jgi:hypothetical protein
MVQVECPDAGAKHIRHGIGVHRHVVMGVVGLRAFASPVPLGEDVEFSVRLG